MKKEQPFASRSGQRQQLSRTKIELFLECPRCFFDDIVGGISRPSSPAYTLNIAVDALLKAEFDKLRDPATPHRLFKAAGLNLVPFAHPNLEQWRSNFTGVRWKDPVTGWTLYGAVDDIWQTPTGSLVVADYKATARKADITVDDIYDGYKRQMEVYQFILEQQGFSVESRAWFLYANGISSKGTFDGVLAFRESLLPYDGNREWVPGTFREAVSVATSGTRPTSGTACKWCEYVAAVQAQNTGVP